MHISDGVLSESAVGNALLIGGAALALAGTAWGLRKMDYERVPRVAVLASAFFTASLIHVKVGPGSVHLILNGLLGVILGWAAFPALAVALLLQAVFFGHGGLTTLGINTFNFGLAALCGYYLCNGPIRRARSNGSATALGFAAGAISVVAAAALFSAELTAAGEEFELIAQGVFVAHLPVAAIEGLVTAAAVSFLRRVKPELLEAPLLFKGEIHDA